MTTADPLLGCHVSVAGGFDRAVQRGEKTGCTAIQIFTRNQLRWKSGLLSERQIKDFRHALKTSGVREVCAHGSYLPNLASPDPESRRRSIESVREELCRCGSLGIPFLIVHPGSHLGEGESAGIRRVVSAVDEAFGKDPGSVKLLVETTAGQGTSIGYRFEHLRDIIAAVGPERAGACLDTCHVFAAGYDLKEDEYDRTLERWERIVGLPHLHVIHLNDSKGAVGSRIDRHEHIGEGAIGIEPFARFMRDERFVRIAKIFETPKKKDGADMDRENLKLLVRLSQG
ncbi:MAG: deoxyribonuclease IV [Spirochaetes bacterium]|nr:deoxyribonuclease IV [Spirochaetota bacterium]